jgi:hypothetical protein
MKRHESRKISRTRTRLEKQKPTQVKFTNPFEYLFQKSITGQALTPIEKQLKHQLKMKADQKSAKARQNRKRNKV